MKRTAGGVVLLALALVSAGAVWPDAQAQEPSCLHGDEDETPEQRTRRIAALQFTRHVNNLQAKAFPSNKAYQPAERLGMSQTIPPGFTLKMSVSGREYAFSVVDSSDPCRFGYFSDDSGLIFRGEVIR